MSFTIIIAINHDINHYIDCEIMRVLIKVVRSRVIGDLGGYRRLFAYLAVFGREGVG